MLEFDGKTKLLSAYCIPYQKQDYKYHFSNFYLHIHTLQRVVTLYRTHNCLLPWLQLGTLVLNSYTPFYFPLHNTPSFILVTPQTLRIVCSDNSM